MSFEDIKGQGRAVDLLRTAVRSGKISHAYIFAGPDGCGKAVLAGNFIKALNCEDTNKVPCDKCSSCRKIDRNTHPDVIWIKKNEKAAQIKINQIRELENRIALKPYQGRYKAYVIEEAERMTVEAANSFLKMLEEPPGDSLLILIAEKYRNLLPTIRSRCQLVRLNPIQAVESASFLDDVLEEFLDGERTWDYSAADRNKLSRKLNILASWYRDLMVYKTTQDENLLIHSVRCNDIRRTAGNYSMDKLIHMFESVLMAKERIESNVNPKLALSALFNGKVITRRFS